MSDHVRPLSAIARGGFGMRCACGYEAVREEDLDAHIMFVVYVVDESAGEHRES